jgi:RNA polymerase primary sigma factor
VAKKYQNQGVLLSDLINEGNVGLIRAAHKFDETKGIKFISYAVWWIRQAILQALAEQSRIVRVPLNRAGALHRIGRRSSTLLQELGREPTVDEMRTGPRADEEEVASTLAISQSHLSLDAPLAPGRTTASWTTFRTSSRRPRGRGLRAGAQGDGRPCPSTLTEREAKVLRLYFGLDDQEPMTLEEIGSLLGITRERVRQIKEKALDPASARLPVPVPGDLHALGDPASLFPLTHSAPEISLKALFSHGKAMTERLDRS